MLLLKDEKLAKSFLQKEITRVYRLFTTCFNIISSLLLQRVYNRKVWEKIPKYLFQDSNYNMNESGSYVLYEIYNKSRSSHSVLCRRKLINHSQI